MKLRNKKTGEIVILIDHIFDQYNSFSEVNEEWEDYEEPKEYWCIDWTGGVNHITLLDGSDTYEENKKEIGNYFKTKEEAEKAVEKLKAWKRLRDNGFKFDYESWKNSPLDEIAYHYDLEKMESVYKDLEIILKEEE